MRGKPKDGSKNPGGRPRKYGFICKADTIEGKIEEMASYSLAMKEIASILDLSESVIYQTKSYHSAFKRGTENCNSSLRRRQYLEAMKGNTTMLVWLGKQRLNQKDKSEIGGPDGRPIPVTLDAAKEAFTQFVTQLAQRGQSSERVQ